MQSPTPQWLAALDMALNGQFPGGAQEKGLSLLSDHGWQPTSVAFMRACSTLGIHQAFPSDNTPQGHADTARVMRTLKEECLWLQAWTSPVTFASALKTWIDQYNEP